MNATIVQQSLLNEVLPTEEETPLAIVPHAVQLLPAQSTKPVTRATLANAVASLSFQSSKDISSCGVYKVKIKRGPCSIVPHQQKENITNIAPFKRKSLSATFLNDENTASSKPLNTNNLNLKDDTESSSSSSSNSTLLSAFDLKNKSQKFQV